MAPSSLRSKFVPICILINIVSSIAIVLVNKWIYTHHKFPNITLTFIHFAVTSLGLKICNVFDLFQVRSLRLRSVLPLSISFCGFVVLANLSLQWNSVGTYQLIKVLTTPCIMLIQTTYYGKTYSKSVLFTLLPITMGVFLNSFYDIKFNWIGAGFALTGVLVTSVYQVWVGSLQRDLNVNSMQLLFYQAPLSASLLVLVIPFFEPVIAEGGLFSAWPAKVWCFVFLSSVIAFSINLTIFLIIGSTSPVTYNMAGHLKFCLTFVVGYLFFHDVISLNQILGVLCTLAGVIMYSHIKLKLQTKENNSMSRKI